MNASNLIEALGWTLVHSLWQGALVAAALWLLLQGLHSAAARYLAAVSALGTLLLFAAGTFWLELPRPFPTPRTTVSAPGSTDFAPTYSEFVSVEMPVTPTTVAEPPRRQLTQKSHWQGWIVAFWFGGVALFGMRSLWDWHAASPFGIGTRLPGCDDRRDH